MYGSPIWSSQKNRSGSGDGIIAMMRTVIAVASHLGTRHGGDSPAPLSSCVLYILVVVAITSTPQPGNVGMALRHVGSKAPSGYSDKYFDALHVI